MGKRADTKVLYNTSKKCVVEGIFDIAPYHMQDFFSAKDLDYSDEIIVRREITPSGKSRGFVNDTPVHLPVLQQLSGALIDLHQQFDTLDIHKVSFQLRVIDALANNKSVLEQYGMLFRKYQHAKSELEQLKIKNRQAKQEEEFIRFQLNELTEANLQESEQTELEEALSRLTNAEGIKRVAGDIARHIEDSEQSVVLQLQELLQALGTYKQTHSALETLYKRLESNTAELEDLAKEFGGVADSVEHDPERIIETQERLDTIYKLQNKHQCTSVLALLELQEQLQNKLDAMGDTSEEIERLEQEVATMENQLRTIAETLRDTRQAVIPDFEKKVLGLLAQLAMEHAQLEVRMSPLEELTATGLDEINFYFAANMGSRLQLIKDVASGGELSRLTLVTKSLVASAIPLPTLLFDEIDTGISGDVSLKMGRILRQLSDNHQVVSITHSPQIASKADGHYFVYKTITEGRTYTRVKALTQEERIRAIAVMLSSNPPSESALENARELIG